MPDRRKFVTAWERIGSAVRVSVLAGGLLFTLSAVTRSPSSAVQSLRATDIALVGDSRDQPEDRDDPDEGANGFVDIYGNEVTDAIATYTFDQAGSLSAQQPKTFKARLSPVPIDVSMQATIAGSGSVVATLTGTRLAITGSFEGLRSPATIAQIHKGPTRGVRGPN